MGVKPRGDSFQADFIVNGKRVRRSFPTEKQAAAFELHTTAYGVVPEEPTPHEAPPETLAELFDRVQKAHWNLLKSPETAESNASVVLGYIGNPALAHVSQTTVDHLISRLLEAKLAKGTINRKLATLQKALKWAAERQWIVKCPVFRRLREPKGRIRFFTLEEETKILGFFEWSGEHHMRDLCVLLGGTGMRLGEGLRLRLQDIDFERRQIRIWVNKADEPRSVPMTETVFQALTRQSPKLFEGVSRNSAEHRWSRMRKEIGFAWDKQFLLHTFRHTCASRLLQGGANIVVVQQFLGHRSIQTTLRYAHLTAGHLQDAARILEAQGIPEATSSPHPASKP